MIRHVIQRIMPQADSLYISTQDDAPEIQDEGLTTIPDLLKRHRGPLTGLYSAMQYIFDQSDQEWLLLCPCDAPFLPLDLQAKLKEEAARSGKPISVACYEKVPQPTFSLWNRSVFAAIEEAVVNKGRGGLMYMLDHLPHGLVDWPVSRIPPFFNVNTRADLQMAERLLDAGK